MMTTTYYMAVAQWGFPDDLSQPAREHRSATFVSLTEAQNFALEWGGHDPDALLKVYEGYYDRDDDEFVEVADYYYDGKEWGR